VGLRASGDMGQPRVTAGWSA